MSEPRKPSYWAVLPANVRYDTNLRPNAKLLYAEITALADTTGYCWATNDHLAGLFGIAARTVSDLVRTLSERGYITVEVLRDPSTNEVVERRLWVASRAIVTDAPPPAKNGNTPPANSSGTPPAKNGDKNNINKLNVIPPKAPHGGRVRQEPKKAPDWKPERFTGFWSFYPRGENKQGAIRAWDKLHPSDELIAAMGHAIKRQLSTRQWQEGIGIPYASTWLNGRRWEDESKAAPSGGAAGGGWAADPEVF